MRDTVPLFCALLLGAVPARAYVARPEGDQIPLVQRPIHDAQDGSLDDFIQRQSVVAWDSLLCNVGPGECVHGASAGVVVASPDRVDPPYFFTWTRDSALVMKYIIDAFVDSNDTALERRIQHYAETQARLQSVSNPSGTLRDGTGLGEAKFKVNLRPFRQPWGRPQRDGPALRAITMISYANHLLQNGQRKAVSDFLWPVIRNDLSYVAQYWNDTGFDLWEEVPGSSFFTTAAQHRALTEGAALTRQLGKACESCEAIAPHILCFLQSFWSENKGYAVANANTHIRRSGKDINTILTSTHNFDLALGCDPATFQPCSDRALANHKAVTDSFRAAGLYPVNAGVPQGVAVAVGRYPEDVYYSGNPWYLATLAAAEQLYDALLAWEDRGSVAVTPASLAFFRDLVPDLAVGEYPAGSAAYSDVTSAVRRYADGYLDVVRRFTPGNGSLSEQFHKQTGEGVSAHDLTWSYAAFLAAAARRAGVVPRSWAAAPVAPPTTCLTTTVRGRYSAPVETTFPLPPGETRPDEPPADTNPPCETPTEIPVVFRELVETRWGETVKIVGNVAELGGWNVDQAPALDPSGYAAEFPVWEIDLDLPVGETVEYKFVRVDERGRVRWEQDPNHVLTVPAMTCGDRPVNVGDVWQD